MSNIMMQFVTRRLLEFVTVLRQSLPLLTSFLGMELPSLSELLSVILFPSVVSKSVKNTTNNDVAEVISVHLFDL